jgi:hypothetical protein
MNKLSIMHVTLFLIILGGGLFTSGCSSDDEAILSIKIDKDTVSYYGDLSIIFQLQDMNGTAMTSFKEGENFMFRLVLLSTGKQKVNLPSIRELTQFDIFHVYTIDGKDMGLPWDYMGKVGNPLFYGSGNSLPLNPNQPYFFECYWFDCDKSVSSDFGKNTPRAALPKGKYYTQFELNLGEDKKVVERKEFTIE